MSIVIIKFEGPPGSGKTILSNKIKEYLELDEIDVFSAENTLTVELRESDKRYLATGADK